MVPAQEFLRAAESKAEPGHSARIAQQGWHSKQGAKRQSTPTKSSNTSKGTGQERKDSPTRRSRRGGSPLGLRSRSRSLDPTSSPTHRRGSPSGPRSRNRSLEATSRRIRGERETGGTCTTQEPVTGKQAGFASPEGVDPKAPNKLLIAAATRNEVRLAQATSTTQRHYAYSVSKIIVPPIPTISYPNLLWAPTTLSSRPLGFLERL